MKNANEIVKLQQRIAPELGSLIEERHAILKFVQNNQPVGRRVLASQLSLPESSVRSGVKALKDAGFVQLASVGMSITDVGSRMLDELSEYMSALTGLVELERSLEQELGLVQVRIVHGDCDSDAHVFNELGRVAARLLGELLEDGMIVAVSGGLTMAMVAGFMDRHMPNTLVVPTRGGLGETVERQANNVAAVMAGKLGGKYRLLHIPEILNDEALEALKATDASIAEIETLIKDADVLVHGIGRADDMVRRRNHMPKVAENICKFGVGETLGHYFDLSGRCIYTYSANGFRLNDLAGVGRKVAVAGGKTKAEAIMAVIRAGSNDVLVVDESAAEAIQSIIKSEKSQKTF